jgi:hypothetical protein
VLGGQTVNFEESKLTLNSGHLGFNLLPALLKRLMPGLETVNVNAVGMKEAKGALHLLLHPAQFGAERFQELLLVGHGVAGAAEVGVHFRRIKQVAFQFLMENAVQVHNWNFGVA